MIGWQHIGICVFVRVCAKMYQCKEESILRKKSGGIKERVEGEIWRAWIFLAKMKPSLWGNIPKYNGNRFYIINLDLDFASHLKISIWAWI